MKVKTTNGGVDLSVTEQTPRTLSASVVPTLNKIARETGTEFGGVKGTKIVIGATKILSVIDSAANGTKTKIAKAGETGIGTGTGTGTGTGIGRGAIVRANGLEQALAESQLKIRTALDILKKTALESEEGIRMTRLVHRV
jgi:hypothetical protein